MFTDTHTHLYDENLMADIDSDKNLKMSLDDIQYKKEITLKF